MRFCLPSRLKSAMAEILVSDLRDCRPPLLTAGFFVAARERGLWLHAALFRWLCALLFPLIPIVPAPAAFLSRAQGLAL
jgi:hypothetical protein